MLHRLLFLLLIMPATAIPLAAEAQTKPALERVQSVEGITEYRLGNGLVVLLAPDGSKPTTTVNLTYRVGSRHENYGETGMAHLLEHLIFKGTPTTKNALAEFSRRGLRANGSTWFDRTNYFASFSANEDNLRWFLSWHADAMVNSFIARGDLDSEMTVVRNEMEMGENDPSRVLFEKTLAAMYQWHNYGKSTIGARSDVENVDIASLQAFYRKYYQPDNATLIVTGRFDEAKVRQWVAEYFGKIPRPKRVLPTLYTLDAVQDGERGVTLRRVGGVPLVFAAYHVPQAAHPDYAAIEALSLILGDEPSGRLYKQLVQKELAASVFSFSSELHDPGFMLLGAQLAPGQDPERARAETLAVVESTGKEPVTEAELQRAKLKWLKDWDLQYTNPETVGVKLSEVIGAGDWRLFFLLRDRVRDLKLADVQRVATERLLQSNRTLGVFIPTEQPNRAPAPVNVDVAAMLKGYKGDPTVTAAEAFDASPANIEKRTERFALASGLEAALVPKGTRGKVVQAQLVLRLGDQQSMQNLGEVPSFTAGLLDRGTAKLDRQSIQDRFDALKAQVSFSGGGQAVAASITTTRDNLPQVIALVGELLRESTFAPVALEELRRQALAHIAEQRQEPGALIDNALDRHGNPYPRGDLRYARSFDEIVADTKAVTAEQVRDFHARYYGASAAQFGASGDMDVAAVRKALEAAFGDWRAKQPHARVPTPLVAVQPERLIVQTPDKQNATMLVRQPLPVSDESADYAAFMLANRLLGQGGNSRLWARIRETQGLSYDVRSDVAWNSHEPNSIWQTSAIFAPGSRQKVETAFREELQRALAEGYTQRELDEAKKGLLAARQLSRSQDRNLANALASNLYLDRTFLVSKKVDEEIAALTLAQVNAALRKYLEPARFVWGFGGDFKDTKG